MAYAGVRQVQRTVTVGTSTSAESNATTTETYDRQGRLSTVAEPSGSGGTVVTTTYGYDVGSRLHTTSTPSGSVTQNRAFNYDNRGFLTSEQHPEKGATGNGTVTYSSYDARGHAGRVTDGPNDIGLVYDRAERLNQAKKDLLQHFYDAYGLGPYLQSDPGSFTDALGNTVQDPDPR